MTMRNRGQRRFWWRSPRQALVAFFLALVVAIGLPALLPSSSSQPHASDPTERLAFSQMADRGGFGSLTAQPALAQRLNTAELAQQVYAAMPELPLENAYVSAETGEPDTDNTLVSRLIRYHLFVARRRPVYRLDWKLTLADYLGVNEWVRAEVYPGADDLNPNPRDGDIAQMNQLNRAQRDELVSILVEVFTSEADRLPGSFRGF